MPAKTKPRKGWALVRKASNVIGRVYLARSDAANDMRFTRGTHRIVRVETREVRA